MAEQYNPVDFSTLSAVDDGKTLLYTDDKVCRSISSLGELINDKIGKKSYATETYVNNSIEGLSGTVSTEYATKEDLGKVGNFNVTDGDEEGPELDPSEAETKSIYLVKDETVTSPDQYREWIVTENEQEEKEWTCIGDTTMDLSDYAKTTYVDSALTHYYNKTETSSSQQLTNAFNDKQDTLTFAGENDTISAINSSAIAQPDLTPYDIRISQLEDTISDLTTLLNSYSGRWVLTPEQPTTVTIGGREYLTVKIGNQEWMAENLDYAYDGIVFRDGINGNTLSDNLSNYTQEASYYDYDENNSDRGLLYNWKAVNYLETNKSTLLPNGWRVPNRQDWSTLMDSIGYSWEGSPAHSLGGTVIRSIDWNGTDDFGFCAKGAGTFTKMAGFNGLDTKLNFWEIPESTENEAYSIRITKTDDVIYENTDSKIGAFSVRLVRDIT